jgi:PadR family transcriptional regulator, regulatory protein PadR
MADTRADMLQGTLDLLILETLSLGSMHGWGISQRIQEMSSDVLQVNQGSLYPALHRLEHKGLIASEWGVSENNRRAKYYRLSTTGKRSVQRERAEWRRFAAAMEQVLAAAAAQTGGN